MRAQPDRRLVTLAREGHGPAIEEAVRRYRTELVQYAATIVPADRADDVVQDSIAKALPSIRGGDAELQLRLWLYAIVRNTALNNLRDAGPRLEHLDENLDGVEQPPHAFERREDLRSVVTSMNELPLPQRDALVKREMEGLSHSEIGSALGISVAAARQLIHRGRSTLRAGLGAMIPMPVMRQILEGADSSSFAAGTATAAGGVVATKAVVFVVTAGGLMTAGVALNRSSHEPAHARPLVAERTASEIGGDSQGSTLAPLSLVTGSSADRSGVAKRAGGEDRADATFSAKGNTAADPSAAGAQGGPKAADHSGHPGPGLNEDGGGHPGKEPGHLASGDDGRHPDPDDSGHGGPEGSDDGESGGGHSGSGGRAPGGSSGKPQGGSATVTKSPAAPPDEGDDHSGSDPHSSTSGSSSSPPDEDSESERDLGD